MTVDELIDKCARFGIDVFFIPLALAGVYWHEQSKIIIDSRMPPSHQLATLAHEYVHAVHCHDGCQAPDVEAWVDRKAARLLVSPVEYAAAEGLHEGNLVAIACELDLPVWVIHAYVAGLRVGLWVGDYPTAPTL